MHSCVYLLLLNWYRRLADSSALDPSKGVEVFLSLCIHQLHWIHSKLEHFHPFSRCRCIRETSHRKTRPYRSSSAGKAFLSKTPKAGSSVVDIVSASYIKTRIMRNLWSFVWFIEREIELCFAIAIEPVDLCWISWLTLVLIQSPRYSPWQFFPAIVCHHHFVVFKRGNCYSNHVTVG